MSNIWETLAAVNINNHVKSKQGLSYLSWAYAWGAVKEKYPEAKYTVVNFDGKPFLHDEVLGYLVQTEVTIEELVIPMHLFVMDGANKAQKSHDYEYLARGKAKNCIAATMFDINTTIMRCLVKNLAMFGLGYYLYAGEDLPIETESARADRFAREIELDISYINNCKNIDELISIFKGSKHQRAITPAKDVMKEKLTLLEKVAA
jgi:hypothetical protein